MLIKVSILLPKFGFGSYGTHPIPTLIVLNMHYSYRENKLHKVLMKNFLKNISSNHTFANSWFFKLNFLPDAMLLAIKLKIINMSQAIKGEENKIKKLKEVKER